MSQKIDWATISLASYRNSALTPGPATTRELVNIRGGVADAAVVALRYQPFNKSIFNPGDPTGAILYNPLYEGLPIVPDHVTDLLCVARFLDRTIQVNDQRQFVGRACIASLDDITSGIYIDPFMFPDALNGKDVEIYISGFFMEKH